MVLQGELVAAVEVEEAGGVEVLVAGADEGRFRGEVVVAGFVELGNVCQAVLILRKHLVVRLLGACLGVGA